MSEMTMFHFNSYEILKLKKVIFFKEPLLKYIHDKFEGLTCKYFN